MVRSRREVANIFSSQREIKSKLVSTCPKVPVGLGLKNGGGLDPRLGYSNTGSGSVAIHCCAQLAWFEFAKWKTPRRSTSRGKWKIIKHVAVIS